MDELVRTIQSEIKKKYKSARQFAQEIGIPTSTLSTIFSKGTSGVAFNTVKKMCQTLNINLDSCQQNILLPEERELILKYNELDKIGKHTVQGIIEVEHSRCKKREPKLAAFGGYSSDDDSKQASIEQAVFDIENKGVADNGQSKNHKKK